MTLWARRSSVWYGDGWPEAVSGVPWTLATSRPATSCTVNVLMEGSQYTR